MLSELCVVLKLLLGFARAWVSPNAEAAVLRFELQLKCALLVPSYISVVYAVARAVARSLKKQKQVSGTVEGTGSSTNKKNVLKPSPFLNYPYVYKQYSEYMDGCWILFSIIHSHVPLPCAGISMAPPTMNK